MNARLSKIKTHQTCVCKHKQQEMKKTLKSWAPRLGLTKKSSKILNYVELSTFVQLQCTCKQSDIQKDDDHEVDDELDVDSLTTNVVKQQCTLKFRVRKGKIDKKVVVGLKREHCSKTYAFNNSDVSMHLIF